MARALSHDAIYDRTGPLWNTLDRGVKDTRLDHVVAFLSYVQQDSETEKALGQRSSLDEAKEFFTGANRVMGYERTREA